LSEPNTDLLAPVQNGHINPALEFANGQFVFTMHTLGGTRVEKLVSPMAVREAFTLIPVDSGWLAPNLKFGGVVRWGLVRGVEWCVMFLPPARHNLELTEMDGPDQTIGRIEVALPGIVVAGFGVSYFIWAVKTGHLDPFQEIYRAPLPNIYADGAICWGAQKQPQASASAIAETWALFAYQTTFNNHLPNAKSKSEREDVRKVLRATAAEGCAYPVDDLMRQVAQTGVTLDAAIKTYLKTGEMPQ
jgi:Prokaryotic E2 family D